MRSLFGGRSLAPLSLIAAALLFIITLPFRDDFFWGLLHAFAEAGVIGALADWFAVVALFRHPFGIPIPHTAIIPKHRAKLSNAIIDMVQNRWLTRESILDRVATWNVGASIASLLRDEYNRRSLLHVLRAGLGEIIRGLHAGQLSKSIASLLRDKAKDDDLLRWVRAGGKRAIEWGWHDVALTQLLQRLGPWLSTPDVRKLIIRNLRKTAETYADNPFRRLGKTLAEGFNALNYDDLADAIIRTVGEEIQRISDDPSHPARNDVEQWARDAVEGLHEHPPLLDALRRWRSEMLETDRLAEMLEPQLDVLRNRLLHDLESENSVLVQHLSGLLEQAIDSFIDNAAAQNSFDEWIKHRLAAVVEQYHGEIGGMVSRNLERLDDETLVRQIEDKVGDDLQFIRLNGAIVGGMVGAVIYLVIHFTGL